MRWFHEGVDRLHVALLKHIVPAVFRHGVESPSLTEHLAAVRLTLPPLRPSAGHYTLTADTLAGPLQSGFQVHPGPQPGLPVLVFHHGIGEIPYDKTFRGICRGALRQRAHLVAVRAPFHRHWLELLTGLDSMQHFLALCAVALQVGEAVRSALLASGAHGSLVVGNSLGGFLSLIHHLHIGTAEAYLPLFAGPDLAHVILFGHLRRLIAPAALAQPQAIQAALDFRAALHASDTRRLAPLLARYDQDMLYAYHAACYAACHVPIVTLTRGHLTGALAFTALRAHILTCLQQVIPTT
ncbi:MAG: hypothetical protein AB7N91_08305 [Candidatus Tectimicrobiota bacterium]